MCNPLHRFVFTLSTAIIYAFTSSTNLSQPEQSDLSIKGNPNPSTNHTNTFSKHPTTIQLPHQSLVHVSYSSQSIEADSTSQSSTLAMPNHSMITRGKAGIVKPKKIFSVSNVHYHQQTNQHVYPKHYNVMNGNKLCLKNLQPS